MNAVFVKRSSEGVEILRAYPRPRHGHALRERGFLCSDTPQRLCRFSSSNTFSQYVLPVRFFGTPSQTLSQYVHPFSNTLMARRAVL